MILTLEQNYDNMKNGKKQGERCLCIGYGLRVKSYIHKEKHKVVAKTVKKRHDQRSLHFKKLRLQIDCV